MSYSNRDMSGALFPNDKGDNAQRPDWRGDVTIAGVTYRLAGWVKEGRKGEFISLRVSTEQATSPREDKPSPSAPALNDEIPF